MYVCGCKYVGDAGGGREETRDRDRLTDGRPKSSSVANRNLLVSPSASHPVHPLPILDSRLGCSKKLIRRKSGRTEPLLRCTSSPSSLPQGLLLSLPTYLPTYLRIFHCLVFSGHVGRPRTHTHSHTHTHTYTTPPGLQLWSEIIMYDKKALSALGSFIPLLFYLEKTEIMISGHRIEGNGRLTRSRVVR